MTLTGTTTLRSILTFIFVLSFTQISKAETYWNLQIGGMYDHIDYDDSNKIDWFAEFGPSFQLSKTNFVFEPTLRYHMKYYVSRLSDWDCEYGYGNMIELPLKMSYDLHIGEKSFFRIGVAPYLSYVLTSPIGYSDNNLHIGLEPSLSFHYKNFNIGVSYSNPCIYKGWNNENRNCVLATIGVRFDSGTLEAVGAGALAVAVVTASAYAESQSNNNDSYNTVSNQSTTTYIDDNMFQNEDSEVKKSKSHNRKKLEESNEKLKKSKYASQNIRSYQNRMNVIFNELSDRKADPEHYLKASESTSQFCSRVRELQKMQRN